MFFYDYHNKQRFFLSIWALYCLRTVFSMSQKLKFCVSPECNFCFKGVSCNVM
jgi:hypothetical protein